MSFSLLFIWSLAILLGVVVYVRDDSSYRSALKYSIGQLIVILPRMILALAIASFISVLVPPDLISHWVGGSSGATGFLIAAVAGALVPGGPVVAFPVAVLLSSSGAGVPQIVTFITAWSIFAVHRIMLFEISQVGWRYTALRLLVSIPLPFVAGLLSQQLILDA